MNTGSRWNQPPDAPHRHSSSPGDDERLLRGVTAGSTGLHPLSSFFSFLSSRVWGVADAGRTPHPFGCLSCCVLNMLHATWKSGFTGLGGRREALEQMPSNSVWNTSKSQDMPSTMPLLASHPPGSDSDAFASCALAEAVSSGDSSVSTSNLNLGEVISSGWVRLSFLSQPPSFSPLIIRNRFHQVECGKSSSLNCIRGGFEVEGGTYPALNLNSGRIRVECGISCE